MKKLKDKLTIGEVADLVEKGEASLSIYNWNVIIHYKDNFYLKEYHNFRRIDKETFLVYKKQNN